MSRRPYWVSPPFTSQHDPALARRVSQYLRVQSLPSIRTPRLDSIRSRILTLAVLVVAAAEVVGCAVGTPAGLKDEHAGQFAAAWAELSQSQSYLAFNADPSPAQLERAWQPLKRALDLAPDHPDVLLAQAYFNYRCLGKYELAEKELLAATRLFPNDARFLEPLAFVLRRRGRLEEAIEFIREDELIEATPSAFRLRKRHLDPHERKRATRAAAAASA